MTPSFLEKSLSGLSAALRRAEAADDLATGGGLLQRTSCEAKLLVLASGLAAILWSRSLIYLAAWVAFALLLAWASQIPIRMLGAMAMGPALLFNGFLALPACFLTPGRNLFFGLTDNGVRSAEFLVLRSEACASLVCLLVLSTSWTSILDTLAKFGMPRSILTVAGMSFRYVLLLTERASRMFESRRSRIFSRLKTVEGRRVQQYTAAVLLQKSFYLAEEVHYAMRSRGYNGTVSQR